MTNFPGSSSGGDTPSRPEPEDSKRPVRQLLSQREVRTKKRSSVDRSIDRTSFAEYSTSNKYVEGLCSKVRTDKQLAELRQTFADALTERGVYLLSPSKQEALIEAKIEEGVSFLELRLLLKYVDSKGKNEADIACMLVSLFREPNHWKAVLVKVRQYLKKKIKKSGETIDWTASSPCCGQPMVVHEHDGLAYSHTCFECLGSIY